MTRLLLWSDTIAGRFAHRSAFRVGLRMRCTVRFAESVRIDVCQAYIHHAYYALGHFKLAHHYRGVGDGANPAAALRAASVLISEADRGLGFLLTEAARLLRKLLDRRLHPLGLTRAQWSVLAILASGDGQSQSQLADVLEIEKTTAGRLIDHLEKNGWVERRPIPGDRRQWGVYLTERAGPLIAQVEKIVLGTRAEMLNGLEPQQQHELSSALLSVKACLLHALSAEQSGPGTHEHEDV